MNWFSENKASQNKPSSIPKTDLKKQELMIERWKLDNTKSKKVEDEGVKIEIENEIIKVKTSKLNSEILSESSELNRVNKTQLKDVIIKIVKENERNGRVPRSALEHIRCRGLVDSVMNEMGYYKVMGNTASFYKGWTKNIGYQEFRVF